MAPCRIQVRSLCTLGVMMAILSKAFAIYHGHRVRKSEDYRAFVHFGRKGDGLSKQRKKGRMGFLCGGALITWKYAPPHKV